MIKKALLFTLVVLVVGSIDLPIKAKEQDSNQVKISDRDAEKIIEEADGLSAIKFKAKKEALWIKTSTFGEGKDLKDFVETTLQGKIYATPKLISEVTKKNANKSTPEGVLASFLAASKAGDIKWIIDNFVDDEKKQLKDLYSQKNALENSKSFASRYKERFLIGEVKYNDYTILLVEQVLTNSGIKQKECIAVKETKNGWRMTNALTNDETFDLVFAAFSSGEVISSNSVLNDKALKKMEPSYIP